MPASAKALCRPAVSLAPGAAASSLTALGVAHRGGLRGTEPPRFLFSQGRRCSVQGGAHPSDESLAGGGEPTDPSAIDSELPGHLELLPVWVLFCLPCQRLSANSAFWFLPIYSLISLSYVSSTLQKEVLNRTKLSTERGDRPREASPPLMGTASRGQGTELRPAQLRSPHWPLPGVSSPWLRPLSRGCCLPAAPTSSASVYSRPWCSFPRLGGTHPPAASSGWALGS